MNKNVCLILVALFFCRCHVDKKTNDVLPLSNCISVYDGLLNNVDQLLLSDAIENIDIVNLEVDEKHLFERMENVLVTDSDIFINQLSGPVIRYDRKGFFKNIIGAIGQGPGEFHYCTDIQWDDKNKLLNVFSSLGNDYQVITYTADNKYLKTDKISLPFLNGALLHFNRYDESYFFTRQLFCFDKMTDCTMLIVYDPILKNNVKMYNPKLLGHEKEFENHKVDWNDLSLNYWKENAPKVIGFDSSLMFLFAHNDTVYELNSSLDSLKIRYVMQCGDRPDLQTTHEAMRHDYAFFKYINVTDFLESSNFVYLKVAKDEYLYILQYDKSTGTTKTIKKETSIEKIHPNAVAYTLTRVGEYDDKYDNIWGFTNDLCGGLSFYPDYIDKDHWIDRVDVDELRKIDMEKLKKQSVLCVSQKEKLIKILESLKEDDNPVLMIATLK